MAAAQASFALVAGLGNPGARYWETRHNAGFWYADKLAAWGGQRFHAETKFHGDICRLNHHGKAIHLLKPATFMNRSGQAVAGLARYFNIPPECMLVAHDDLDLPPGTVRLKLGGGEGGHNGLRDLVAHLGTRNFWRLRIGIGHPGHRDQVLAYVLERPNRADEEAIIQALECALAETPRLFDGELEKVMHVLHSRKVSNTLPTGAGD